MKSITLETGGKSPLLVFNDCDLEQAARWGHLGIMSNQGQICTATSRILVQKEVFGQYVSRFQSLISEHKIGDPFDGEAFQGPQVTRAQYDKILGYIQAGKEDGAKLIAGERAYKSNGKDGGFFVEPTVFCDVTEHMRIFQEEVFGPFVTITPFTPEQDAMRLANSTSYGLGAAVFT